MKGLEAASAGRAADTLAKGNDLSTRWKSPGGLQSGMLGLVLGR